MLIKVLIFLAFLCNCSAAQFNCHGTECSTTSETCCPDPRHGSICCVSENTRCCPPTKNGVLPSRCCPQWSICCELGRDGCCNPLEKGADTTPAAAAPQTPPTTAYALFDISSLFGPFVLQAFVIDVATGSHTSKTIKGYKTWGEATRSFVFDGSRQLFHLAQANFTGSPPSEAITLYSVDPVSGTLAERPVHGAKGLPTGFAYSEADDALLLATYSSAAHLGYSFYTVKLGGPGSAPLVATRVSTSQFAPNQDNWVGWFDQTAGDFAFRVGYANPKTSIGPGLSVANWAASATVKAEFHEVPSAFATSLNLKKFLPGTGRVIIGTSSQQRQLRIQQQQGHQSRANGSPGLRVTALAAAFNDTDVAFVDWSVAAQQMRLGQPRFTDAHQTPDFGPLAATLAPDHQHYLSVAVVDSDVSNKLDRFSLILCTLATDHCTKITLEPWLFALIDSSVALGVAHTQ